jgi:hypothetical protein
MKSVRETPIKNVKDPNLDKHQKGGSIEMGFSC